VPVPTFKLDHIVVAASTLDKGAAYVRDCLGVEPSGGGNHPAMGTHNRVLKLGRNRYLEVIAIDPEGRPSDFPRWFNLDEPALQSRLKIRPRLIAWVVRSESADSIAEAIYGTPTRVRPMQRDALRWRFAFTRDGSLPGEGTDSPYDPVGRRPSSRRIDGRVGLHIDGPGGRPHRSGNHSTRRYIHGARQCHHDSSGFETPTGGPVRADQDAHRRGGAGLIPIRKQRLWARACVLAQLKSSTQRCDAGGFNIAAALT
jgi:hypothetical protein